MENVPVFAEGDQQFISDFEVHVRPCYIDSRPISSRSSLILGLELNEPVPTSQTNLSRFNTERTPLVLI